MHYKRVKATYDRGYVNAMDKIRVFIESTGILHERDKLDPGKWPGASGL